jgi:hypothetical protein
MRRAVIKVLMIVSMLLAGTTTHGFALEPDGTESRP